MLQSFHPAPFPDCLNNLRETGNGRTSFGTPKGKLPWGTTSSGVTETLSESGQRNPTWKCQLLTEYR